MPSNLRILSKHTLAFLLALALILPSPMLVSEATAATIDTGAKVDSRLTSYIETMAPGEMVPISLQFPEGTSETAMRQALDAMDLDLTIRHVFHMIPYISAYAGKTEIQELAANPAIAGVILDVEREVLDLTTQGTFVLSEGELGYEHFTGILEVDGLWDQGYYGNETVIAIIDSGVDGEHPDIQDRLIGFKDFVGTGTDMDPTGGISAYDDNGHGTACAWNVAGTGKLNGGNFTGVAPGANLLAVKVLDELGGADDSLIAESMEWAVDNGADVLSLSLGGEWVDSQFLIEPSAAMTQEAVSQGVSVVIAAGNSGPAPFTINSPGIVDEAVTVGSSAGSAGIVAFSSRGPVHRLFSEPTGYYSKPDIIAPGYFVVSGRADGADSFEYPTYNSSQFGDAYTAWSGTSASAPQIAGLIALLLDKHPTMTPLQAKIALMQGSTDLGADPMEQGWGLANVTKADEILDASLPNLTLMTPRKYPTLPGTSNVLIVGDDRPDQNVTIMSSENLGDVDIIKSGNASQFIRLSQEAISVGVGYTYFGIGLEIPEGLPLSAIGRYTGKLVLEKDAAYITSIDLDLAVTTYGGKMLIDMAHHDEDVDDPSAYRYFTGYLREQGVVVDTFGNSVAYDTARIDSGDLAGAEIFTIMDTELPYSSSEIAALHQFVEDGGVLLMLSEFYDVTLGAASFGIDSYNEILEPFGIQCERIGIGIGPTDTTGQFYGVDYGGAVESNPLMEGVTDLYVLSGSTLSVDPAVAGAQGLFWLDADKEHAIVATVDYGNGRIIVISDGSTLYDDILYDAIRGGADNLRMLRNIAQSIVPSTPRIFDVEISTAGIGQEANFTAFVFDDDLAEVTMSIWGPDDTQVVGTVEETLGYRYTAGFILQSGGFYDVLITARDTDDNVKIFEKVFLIPLDPAEDQFITTVTWTLLGVTGAALLYVGLNKAGIHRRRAKPRQPEYWDDGTPPSIS